MTGNEMALMSSIAVDMQDKEVNAVLDKIRAEIYKKSVQMHFDGNFYIKIDDALQIIDKYAEQEPCDDAISRQAVIKLVRGCNSALEEPRIFNSHNSGVVFEQYINELPSVRPQEPQESDEISERNMKMWLDIFEEEKRRAE